MLDNEIPRISIVFAPAGFREFPAKPGKSLRRR
jgi:hypothetical protein